MKRALSIIITAIIAGIAAPALAQLAPVKVTVTKVQKRETKKEGHADAVYQPYRDGDNFAGGWNRAG